jgi:serine/threonine-protein kinase
MEKSPGAPILDVAGFSPGGRHGCLLATNEVRCWGTDDIGCAVTGNADASGQCLTPTGSIFTRPVTVNGVPPSALIAAGAATSCAVASTNDRVVCWGNNKFLTAGNPQITTTSNFPPSAVALTGVSGISQIVMGNAHACVVANGRIHCWGQNNAGQIGGTPGTNLSTPVEVTSLAGNTHLTAGGFNLCAYNPSNADGALVCMGVNSEGQLGIGTNDINDHATPSSVGDLKDVISASAGGTHACAVARRRDDPAAMPRRVFCWGKNNSGQVVQPASQRVLDPVEVVLPPPT